jgi:hypothetical protein
LPNSENVSRVRSDDITLERMEGPHVHASANVFVLDGWAEHVLGEEPLSGSNFTEPLQELAQQIERLGTV